MTKAERAFLVASLHAAMPERPRETPAEWACQNLIFNESNNTGPFRTKGCEYIIEPLNDFGRVDIADAVLVWGSQTRKTGTLMGGVAWSVVNNPRGVFWVMATVPLARRFSRQRWQKLLRASPVIKPMIPTGAARHNFSTLEQHVGATVINFSGANSPASLSSSPCAMVIMDEVDKFSDGSDKEADAVNLAEQRTKDQASPQRWKTSTPTVVEGLIWQEFLKGDQRRYFIPCPLCGGRIVLAWSPQYTVFPRLGCEAWVKWDPKAKRSNGDWDYDMVERSVHFECSLCKGKIGNEHKSAMVRNGVWKPTVESGQPKYVSRQLSSLYATSTETTLQILAVKFLSAKRSLLGVQGFINGDLAEPYQAQDTLGQRSELISSRLGKPVGGTRLMTVDCQAKSPAFWWVVRSWGPAGSEGIAAGSAETWGELEAIQARHEVRNPAVAIDSGWGARSDNEIYAACVGHSEIIERDDKLPAALGWIPTKGFPGRRMWRDEETGLLRPYYVRDVDPFEGTSKAGLASIGLLGFSADAAKDILEALRKRAGPYPWSVAEAMASEDYWRHMDGEVKEAVRNTSNGRVTHQWRPRSKHWPNHLLDCEVLQVVLASFLRLFEIEQPAEPKRQTHAAPHNES